MTNNDPPTHRLPTTDHGHDADHASAVPTRTIRPVPHELGAHFHWTDGLAPWSALANRLGISDDPLADDHGLESIPPVKMTFTDSGGSPWHATYWAKRSGLTPTQVDPDCPVIHEFVITIERVAYDGRAPPVATYQVRPRTPATPGPEWTGIDVAITGSNVPPADYPGLLHAATRAIDIDPVYFDPNALASSSNLTTLEHYVRVQRDHAQVITGDEGPIRRISQLLATADLSRSVTERRGENTATIDMVAFRSNGARTLIPDHQLGKTIKLYEARDAPNDPTDPLYHPKLCVRFDAGRTVSSIYWEDREAVERELSETLINLVRWSGITPWASDIDTDTSPFVADEHFSACATIEDADHDLPRAITDPLPRIERSQQDSVRMAFESATETQRDVLRVMADGGHLTDPTGPGLHYLILADRAGCSIATVYRTLDQLGALARNADGQITLASTTIAESIRSRFTRRRPRGTTPDTDDGTADRKHATCANTRSAEAPSRGSAPETTPDQDRSTRDPDPWEWWASENGVTVTPDHKTIGKRGCRDGRAQWRVFDLGEVPPEWTADTLREHVADGLEAWTASGRPEETYRGGRFRWREIGDDDTSESVGMALYGVGLSADQSARPHLKSHHSGYRS